MKSSQSMIFYYNVKFDTNRKTNGVYMQHIPEGFFWQTNSNTLANVDTTNITKVNGKSRVCFHLKLNGMFLLFSINK